MVLLGSLLAHVHLRWDRFTLLHAEQTKGSNGFMCFSLSKLCGGEQEFFQFLQPMVILGCGSKPSTPKLEYVGLLDSQGLFIFRGQID